MSSKPFSKISQTMSASEIQTYEAIASKITDELDDTDLALAAEMCGAMSYMGYDSMVTRAAFVKRCEDSNFKPKQVLVRLISLFLERGTKLDFDQTTKTDEDGNQISVRGLTGVSSQARAQIQALKTLLGLRSRTPAGTPPEVLSVGRIIAAFADVAAQIVSSMLKSGIPLRTPVKPQGLMPDWFICPQFCSLLPSSSNEQLKSDVKQWYLSYDKVINRGKQSKKVEDYFNLVMSKPFKATSSEQEALWNKITGRAAIAEARELYNKGKYADADNYGAEAASSSSSSQSSSSTSTPVSAPGQADSKSLSAAMITARNSRNAARLVGKLLAKDKASKTTTTALGAIMSTTTEWNNILSNLTEVATELKSSMPDPVVLSATSYDKTLFEALRKRKAVPEDFGFEP